MNVTYTKQQLTNILMYRGWDPISYDTPTKQLILKQADELSKHIFTFDKPWDMERCIIPYQLPQTIDWTITQHHDEEWTFMLNRMDYLSYLIQAYQINSQMMYLDTCKDLIFQWIYAHPTILPSTSTRTLDSAIRMSNILDAVLYLYHYQTLSDEELKFVLTYFKKQAQYLYEQYIPKYTLSNWGSIQTCVIIPIMAIIDADYKENKIFIWAKQEMETQVRIQVYNDGMFWEQSTMYHIEVLNYLMKLIFMNKILPLKIDKVIYEKAYALADSLALQVTPNYKIEAFGDSDRCLVKDVFARATYVFHEARWKHLAYSTFDIESRYEFGSHPAGIFQEMQPQKESRLVYDGVDSGMFCMRSSWDTNASFTMFTNGSLGSGHGHCDNLHFSLYYQGLPFLIDPGRYTYREENIIRPYLKSMAAHNTIIIDNQPCSIPKGSWDYESFGIVQKTYVKHDHKIHYLEGTFIDEKTTAVHIRKLLVIDPSIWVLCDEIKMQGQHTLIQYFHMDPSITIRKDHSFLLMNGFDSLRADFHKLPKIEEQPFSSRYNELQSHNVINVHEDFQDNLILHTSFYNPNIHKQSIDVYQDQQIVSKDIVTAFKFTISNTESYITIIFHKELYKGRKICFCDGIAFHAKSVVIYQKEGKMNIYRMKC